MSERIFQQLTHLSTPAGTVFVTDGTCRIPFDVTRNPYDVPYSVYAPDRRTILCELHTDTNYALEIDTARLVCGREYRIVLEDTPLHFLLSDQNTAAWGTTIGRVSIGIGAYDPNEDIADETRHTRYRVRPCPDTTGFAFVPLDRTADKITFRAAWIEHDPRFPIDYEDVIGFWLT